MFGNSSTSMREVIITSTLLGFDQKNLFLGGRWSWLKFNNLALAKNKCVKTKSQKVFGANS